jgi:hypothetical protein
LFIILLDFAVFPNYTIYRPSLNAERPVVAARRRFRTAVYGIIGAVNRGAARHRALGAEKIPVNLIRIIPAEETRWTIYVHAV